jgi:hypothetical protein
MKIQNEVAGYFFAILAEILIDRHSFSPLAFLTHTGLRSLIRNSRSRIVLPLDYSMRFFKKEQVFEKGPITKSWISLDLGSRPFPFLRWMFL